MPGRRARTANPAINGEEVRRKRQLAGLSVTEAAALMGISAPYLSLIEGGRRLRCTPSTFGRICDALKVEDRAELIQTTAKAA